MGLFEAKSQAQSTRIVADKNRSDCARDEVYWTLIENGRAKGDDCLT